MVIANQNMLFLVAFALLVLAFAFPTEARRLSTKASSNLVLVENENKGPTLTSRLSRRMSQSSPPSPSTPPFPPIFHPILRAESVHLGPKFDSINFGMLPRGVPVPPSGPSRGTSPGTPPLPPTLTSRVSRRMSQSSPPSPSTPPFPPTFHPILRAESANLGPKFESINFGMLPRGVPVPPSGPSRGTSPGTPPLPPTLTSRLGRRMSQSSPPSPSTPPFPPTFHPILRAESSNLGPKFESINFGMLPRGPVPPSGPSRGTSPGTPPLPPI